jgi:hypothetical protein
MRKKQGEILMQYAALLVFVALVVFIITPNFKKNNENPAPLDLFFREVQYKFGLPKSAGQGAGTRFKPEGRKPPEKTQPQGSRASEAEPEVKEKD